MAVPVRANLGFLFRSGSALPVRSGEDTEKNMYEGIQMHLEGLREDELPVPQLQSSAEYLVIGA